MTAPFNRFDYERAIQASGLPPLTRWIVQVLITKAAWPSGVIPPEYSPSLTDLEADAGLSRHAVQTHLNLAEKTGWIRRDRPTAHAARIDKERTRYALALPEGVVLPDREARTPRALAKPDVSDMARTPQTLGLGPEGSGARAPRVLNQISPDQLSDLSLRERAARDAGLVDPDEREEFIRTMTKTHNIRGDGWWITARDNGTLPDLVADWHRARGQPAAPDYDALRRAAPDCEHGTQHGTFVHPIHGTVHCPLCRRQGPGKGLSGG